MYREIPVYKAEAEAGISGAIQAKENRSVAAYCPIVVDTNVISAAVVEKTKIKDAESFYESISGSNHRME